MRAWGRCVVVGLLLVAGPARAEPGPADAPAWGEVALPLDDVRWARASIGVHAVVVRTGQVIASFRSDRGLVPASAQKAVTAAAALRALGPSYHFETAAYASAPVVGGVLDGDLVIVGGGDPTMTADKVWRLLRDLRTDGLERVTGDVVLDDSFFDDPPAIPGWDRGGSLDEGPSYDAPIGALGVEFGGVGVVVRPGAAAGAPAVVALETPAGRYVRLDGRVTTVGPRDRTRLDLRRTLFPDHVLLTVEGAVREGAGVRRFRRAVHDPTAHFGGIVEDLLASVGPEVEGGVRRGVLPEGALPLRRVVSPPLASILMDMNKYSSNFMAEAVLRTLGAVVHGAGTTETGLSVVRAHLDGIGVPPEESRLVNGSGLSRQIRYSPRALTAVLVDAARDPRIAPELLASLAIGGRDGTLDDRLDDVVDRVRAKTGTLADVVALAGFVEAGSGELIAFTFLANDVRGPVDSLQGLADEVARRLAAAGPANGS